MLGSYMLWCLFLYIFASWLLYPGPQECESLIKRVREKIVQINKEKKARQKMLKGVIADLLEKGLDFDAYQRAKTLHIELTKSSYYVLVEKSCEFVSKNLPLPQELSECSVEYREAISSLMFGAELFTLPELHNLRQILRDRYGSSVEVGKQEVNAFVNTNSPTSEKRVRLMREIASEFSVNWDSEAFEPRMSKSSASAQDPNAFNYSTENTKALQGENATLKDGKYHGNQFQKPKKAVFSEREKNSEQDLKGIRHESMGKENHQKKLSNHKDAKDVRVVEEKFPHYDASGEESQVVRKSISSFQLETRSVMELLTMLAMVNIVQIKRKLKAEREILEGDISELLAQDWDDDAFKRAGRLFLQLQVTSCFAFELVLENLPLQQELSKCPVEYRETILFLIFAAAAFPLPELFQLRQILWDRYGSSLEFYVSEEFPAFVNSKSPLGNRVRLMLDDASAFSIDLDSEIFKLRKLKSSALAAQDPNAFNHSTEDKKALQGKNATLKGVKYHGNQFQKPKKAVFSERDKNSEQDLEQLSSEDSKSESAQESSGGKRFGEGWRQDESNARLILYYDAMRKAAKIKPKVPLDRSNEPRPNHVHPNQPEYHELRARVVCFKMEDDIMPKHH